jgi:phosphoenolpyruvate carboxykinase (ATP)
MQLRETGLEISNPAEVYWNLPTPVLYEEVIRRGEGRLAQGGALVVRTDPHTGRSPQDRFIVREPTTADEIWWGLINQPFAPEAFDVLYERMLDYLEGKDLFVQDLYVCAHPSYRMPIRVITELAWQSLFARNLFLLPGPEDEIPHPQTAITVISAPGFETVPEHDRADTACTAGRAHSGTFIVIHLGKRLILIGGSRYAGEIKKAVFSLLNFLLPQRDVFPMHCSANVGPEGDVALFFGLSGTGKTTLSTDPNRPLIGDDEHGWSTAGVFNFEGGCYAKVIELSEQREPEIYRASLRFGSILENVVLDTKTRRPDFTSAAITENTRSAYPLTHLKRVVPSGGPPRTIFMLTYDAFGVLPPITKLTEEQALDYFLLGYTAKVAGTERGVTEPEATFSPCFAAPFLPRWPKFYAEMLRERLHKHRVSVWLLNTGISGGPYGVGQRIPLAETRAMIRAALDGRLEGVPFEEDPIFGLRVPTSCPGVRSELLKPRRSWRDPKAYDDKAHELARRFEKEIQKFA